MAKRSKEVATQDNGSRAVAQQGPRNAYQQFADEAANQSSIEGSLLKFTREGEWIAGQDEETIPEGTRLIMGLNTLKVGWQKWEDGKPTDSRMGLVSESFRPAQREDLGDLDEDEWEIDPNDAKAKNPRKRDPWQETQSVLLKDPETGEVYTYATSSKSGKTALGDVSKVFGDRLQDGHPAEEMPIITLQSSWYNHKVYKKIYIPVFELTDEWVTPESFKAPKEEPEKSARKSPKAASGRGSSAAGKSGGQPARSAPKALPAPRKSQGGGNRARI